MAKVNYRQKVTDSFNTVSRCDFLGRQQNLIVMAEGISVAVSIDQSNHKVPTKFVTLITVSLTLYENDIKTCIDFDLSFNFYSVPLNLLLLISGSSHTPVATVLAQCEKTSYFNFSLVFS